MSDFSNNLLMKRLFLAVSFAALLVSCGKPITTDNTFENPRFVQYAGQLIPESGTLQYAELTESGMYVATLPGGTKAGPVSDIIDYFSGTYGVAGDEYHLANFGILKFANTSSGEVDLTYSVMGMTSTTTVKATLKKGAQNNDLFRSWTVDKTRVTFKSGMTGGAEFSGCNFREIADFFIKNGYTVEDDIPAGHKLSSVSITAAGSLLFVYSDGSVDLGTCTVSGSNLNYRWNEEGMGFSFETGSASYAFENGKCILALACKLDGTTSVSIKMVLSEMK